MKNSNVFDVVTDRLIDLMEKESRLIWVKPWNNPFEHLQPSNYVTGHQYRGINFFIAQFFPVPLFLSFNQIKEKGLTLKKGSKSVPFVYWNMLYLDKDRKKVTDEKKAVETIPFLRYYNLFNVQDVDGIDLEKLKNPDTDLFPTKENFPAERLISKQKGLQIRNADPGRAYYNIGRDFINMPKISQFRTQSEYYSTLFHELTHWTGHKSRLNRFDTDNSGVLASFGSREYSKEELTAEFGAAFLCEFTGLKNEATQNNSAAYLQGWLRALKNDKKLLIEAAGKAQKAFDFVIEN